MKGYDTSCNRYVRIRGGVCIGTEARRSIG